MKMRGKPERRLFILGGAQSVLVLMELSRIKGLERIDGEKGLYQLKKGGGMWGTAAPPPATHQKEQTCYPQKRYRLFDLIHPAKRCIFSDIQYNTGRYEIANTYIRYQTMLFIYINMCYTTHNKSSIYTKVILFHTEHWLCQNQTKSSPCERIDE